MKKEIKTNNLIDAPIDAIWEQLRTGEGVDRWLPIVTSCKVEGNKRRCTVDGNQLDETILNSDDSQKLFQYAIDKQSLFPISHIVGTMKLHAHNEKQTNLTWDLSFDLQEESLFLEIKEGIENLYRQGAKGLEELAKSTTLTNN